MRNKQARLRELQRQMSDAGNRHDSSTCDWLDKEIDKVMAEPDEGDDEPEYEDTDQQISVLQAQLDETCKRLGKEYERNNKLTSEVEHLRARETHFARVLGVADSGQYRNDWDAAIERVVRERAGALAEVAKLRARLQFDPGGSDKIDELEQAMQFLRHDLEMAEARLANVRACADAMIGVLAGAGYSDSPDDAPTFLAGLVARLEKAEAEASVRGGEWCAKNRAEGRGPCGACVWCCQQARDEAERLRVDRDGIDETNKVIFTKREKLRTWAENAQNGVRRFLVACGPMLVRETGGAHWVDHLRECLNIEWTGLDDKLKPLPGDE